MISMGSKRNCGDCRYFGESCTLHGFDVNKSDEACGSFFDKTAKYPSEYIPDDEETEGRIYIEFEGDMQ